MFLTKNFCKQIILEKFIDNGKLKRTTSTISKNKNMILKKSILYHTRLSKESSLSEIIYWLMNDIKEKPVCKMCGNKVNFKSFEHGYVTYCSNKCHSNDPELIEKFVNTRQENGWFQNNPREKWKIKSLKEKELITKKIKNGKRRNFGNDYQKIITEKARETSFNRVDKNGMNSYDRGQIKGKKSKLNNIDKNGLNSYQRQAKNISKTWHNKTEDEIQRAREKQKETLFKKYGVYHNSHIPGWFNKAFPKKAKFTYEHLECWSKNEFDFVKEWVKIHPLDSIQNANFLNIQYKLNEKIHVYKPDFIVTNFDGTKDIIEIKATHHWFYKHMSEGKIQAKWKATEHFIKNNPQYNKYKFIIDYQYVENIEDLCNF